mmetsp:Transcript_1930/g.4138  ORF Transcript_1930/g.4138 Transcript_1930/m.4138 type:complete len:218 (-) Transcript_1930:263-916(-)
MGTPARHAGTDTAPYAAGSTEAQIRGRCTSASRRPSENSATRPASQSCGDARDDSSVRLALVASVANTPPAVSRHTRYASTVPIRTAPRPSPRSAAPTSARCSTSHRILVPEKYPARGRPVASRKRSAPSSPVDSDAAMPAVRPSSHTIAWPSAAPVVASHAHVVSRWFVMPRHRSDDGRSTPFSSNALAVAAMHAETLPQMSTMSCSCQLASPPGG